MRSDVVMNAYGTMLSDTAVFANSSSGLVREVALHLTAVVALPQQCLFRAGEVGREVFFVVNGKLELMSEKATYLFLRSSFNYVSSFYHLIP